MKKITTIIALLLFTGMHATGQSAHWTWGTADANAPITINPYYAHEVISAHKDQALWGHILNKRAIYTEQLGDHMFSLYDTAGTLLNHTVITGNFSITAAHADDAGNWYLLGKTEDTVDFGGTQIIRTGAGSEYFFCRLNAGDLSQNWLRFAGGDFFCNVSCFTVKNNKIYFPLDSVETTRIYTMDLSNGNMHLLWAQNRSSYSTSIQVDGKGNVYLAGSCPFNGIEFNGGHVVDVPVDFPYPQYIVRYKWDGSYDWSYFMRDVTCGFAREFTLADDNTIYYTGSLNDSMTIGSFHVQQPPAFGSFMVAQLDSNGTVSWLKTLADTAMGTAECSVRSHAVTDEQKGINLLTTALHYVNWGNGVHSYSTHENTTIVHYDVQGNAQWVKQATANYTLAQQIAAGTNALWVTGNAYDSTSIMLDNVTIPMSATPFAYYPFVGKITTSDNTTSVEEVAPNSNYQLIPNPATDQVMIAGIQKGALHIKVSDQTGRIILVQSVNNRTAIATGSWARGMYFVQIDDGQSRTVKKLLLQ